MLKLEDIRKDAQIRGLEPDQVVRVVTTEPVGDDAITVDYKTGDGRIADQMVFRQDASGPAQATDSKPARLECSGQKAGDRIAHRG